MYQELNPYTFIVLAYGLAFLAIVIYTAGCMLIQQRLHAAAERAQNAARGPVTSSS